MIFRVAVVAATLASVLVPAWLAPARTISYPTTLARTIRLDESIKGRTRGVQDLAFRPTHIAFSWAGSEGATIWYREDAAADWIEAPINHDADSAARHHTGVLAVDRPEDLQWRIETDPDSAVTDVILDYLNTLDGPRVSRTVPATAAAAARTPNIVTRAEWGADESLKRTGGGCERRFYPARQMFVHHTAGANFDNRPKATMRAIYWYHVVRQGWCDIGYNFVISYDGRIFEGRWARNYAPWETHDAENKGDEVVAGAHVDGFNSGTIGVSVMGNFENARPSPATRRALAKLLAWEVDRHDLRARGTHTFRNPESRTRTRLPWIAGHRDADSTSCPGDFLYSALPAVRRDTEAVIGNGKASTAITVAASAERISYGEEVTITGALTDTGGVPLGGRAIRTYVRTGTGVWAAGPRATTATDGTFAFDLQPEANVRFAAIYDGDSATWGSQAEVLVRVSPLLTLSPQGAVTDEAGVYHYGPGTDRITFTGTVTPAHPNDAVEIRVAKLQSDGSFARVGEGEAESNRSGSFTLEWQVVDPGVGGTYRARAVFPKHNDHARATSSDVTFVIDPEP